MSPDLTHETLVAWQEDASNRLSCDDRAGRVCDDVGCDDLHLNFAPHGSNGAGLFTLRIGDTSASRVLSPEQVTQLSKTRVYALYSELLDQVHAQPFALEPL